MILRYLLAAVLVCASSFLLSTPVQSNSGYARDDDRASAYVALVEGAGLALAPPHAGAITSSDFKQLGITANLTPVANLRAQSANARRWSGGAADIGKWSELVSSPPSERLHHSATYDPSRQRVVVFGGLTHVWVHGDVSYYALDEDVGWHHFDPTVSPPPRWGHTAVHDPVRDRIIVFGGMGTGTALGDVWELTLESMQWTLLQPAGPGPSARFAHAAIYDPAGDRMLVFGGYDGQFRNDVWELSLAADGSWKRLQPGGPAPPTLDATTAVYDPVRQRMLVFGGFDGVTSRNDVWALSLAGSPQWSALAPAGEPPAIRRQHAAFYDPERDRLVTFGGTAVTQGPGYDDTWALQLAGTPTWESLDPAGTLPTRRWGHSLLYDPVADRALLFGGVDLVDWRNDTWDLALSQPAWRSVQASAAMPAARWGHASIVDPKNDRLLVFLGASQRMFLDDLWSVGLSAPNEWQQVPAVGPSARHAASAIYDPAGERVVLFGGGAFGCSWGDVWELSLQGPPTWTPLAPQGTPPEARQAHSAVFDAQRQRMLVFGGLGPTGERNDVWALDLSGGPKWSELVVAGALPGARQGHTAVYDAARDRMLVFGGIVNGQGSNDAWALVLGDAPYWVGIDAGNSPGTRFGHTAIWDESRDRMLVFGGCGQTGFLNDTWSLTFAPEAPEQATWTQLHAGGTVPVRRAGHSAVLDAARQRMLVFGGTSDIAFFDDAVALDLGPPGPRVPRVGTRKDIPGDREPVAPEAIQGLAIAAVSFDVGDRALDAVVRLPENGPARLDLTDVRGRKVAGGALDGVAGERSVRLDVGPLPRGVYWLHLQQSGRTASERVVHLRR